VFIFCRECGGGGVNRIQGDGFLPPRRKERYPPVGAEATLLKSSSAHFPGIHYRPGLLGRRVMGLAQLQKPSGARRTRSCSASKATHPPEAERYAPPLLIEGIKASDPLRQHIPSIKFANPQGFEVIPSGAPFRILAGNRANVADPAATAPGCVAFEIPGSTLP